MLKEDELLLHYPSNEYYDFAQSCIIDPELFITNVESFKKEHYESLLHIYIRRLNEGNAITLNDSFNSWVKVMYVQYSYNKQNIALHNEIEDMLK